MNIFKSYWLVSELFLTFISWGLIIFIQLAFSWFFVEKIILLTYLLPILLLVVFYASHKSCAGYIVNNYHINLKKSINILWPSILAFATVVFIFIDYVGNFNKELSAIREVGIESSKGSYKDALYIFIFPVLILTFIVANYNDLKHKKFINILALLSCFAFIPINGGRINFLLFGILYFAINFTKDFTNFKKNIFKNILKYIGIILLVIIIVTAYSTLRTGADNQDLVNHISKFQYINSNALTSLEKVPYGLVLIIIIITFYDYTGSNIFHLSIFVDNFDKINYHTYGFYQFNILDIFNIINFKKTHDDIDRLYLNYDINHNVWASIFRDTIVDFGYIGSYIFLFSMGIVLFKTRKYISKSYSAQILYFLTLIFFIFSPYHSFFYVTNVYGTAYLFAIILFIRFKLKRSYFIKKV